METELLEVKKMKEFSFSLFLIIVLKLNLLKFTQSWLPCQISYFTLFGKPQFFVFFLLKQNIIIMMESFNEKWFHMID